MNKTRVLIVDDENMHRQLFSMIIKASETFELAGELSKASMAVEFCRSNEVDFVLMDVVMKEGVNGLQAAEEIKSFNSDIKNAIHLDANGVFVDNPILRELQ